MVVFAWQTFIGEFEEEQKRFEREQRRSKGMQLVLFLWIPKVNVKRILYDHRGQGSVCLPPPPLWSYFLKQVAVAKYKGVKLLLCCSAMPHSFTLDSSLHLLTISTSRSFNVQRRVLSRLYIDHSLLALLLAQPLINCVNTMNKCTPVKPLLCFNECTHCTFGVIGYMVEHVWCYC